MESKQTSKREYQFVIFPESARVDIVDKEKRTLRTFNVTKLSQPIVAILLVHGLKQKLTDDTMVSKIGEDGDRLLALDDLWAQLLAGEWEKERQGVARPPEAAIQFVMEKMDLDRAVAEASLKKKGKDFWTALRENYKDDFARIDKKLSEDKKKAEGIDLADHL